MDIILFLWCLYLVLVYERCLSHQMRKKSPLLFCFVRVWDILELIPFQCLFVFFNSFSFFFYSHLMICFYCFLERKRKVEREDFHWWKSCMCRDRRMNSQPRYVPWPGLEPTSLQIAVTSCKDGTEVKFSSVTYFRKLPSCYYWNIHLHPLWMIRWRFRVRWFCNSSSKRYLKYLCTVFLGRAECSMCHWSNS